MTEQTSRKVPQIRFKGFEGEWAEKELGELADIKLGKMLDKVKHTSGQLLPYLNNISLRWNDVDTSNLPQMYFKDDELERFGLQAGDVVVCEGGEPGRSAIWDGHLPNLKFQKAIHRVRFNVPYEAPLLVLHLQNIVGTNRFEMLFTGGGIKHLTRETFSLLMVPQPSLQEQRDVAHFLSELDSLIGLHQRKHDKLVTLKKAMLQKMFPQPGATTPEIRFKGFLGEWVEKRLDEICEIVGGGTPSTSIQEYWGGDIDWYSPTEIGDEVYVSGSVKKITLLGLSKSSARLLPPVKTILFTSRAGIGDMAILTKEGCTNQGFQSMVLNDETDPYFIFSMGHLIKIHALKHASGSTFLEVSSKQLGKMKVFLPKEDEQQKIGSYFRTLDELITQHATQLQKLRQIKSACLERMFV